LGGGDVLGVLDSGGFGCSNGISMVIFFSFLKNN
jgi:hypothetical protein